MRQRLVRECGAQHAGAVGERRNADKVFVQHPPGDWERDLPRDKDSKVYPDDSGDGGEGDGDGREPAFAWSRGRVGVGVV